MAKKAKAKNKYAVNLMLTMTGKAKIKSIREAVISHLEGVEVQGPDSPYVDKVTVRSVDED